MASGILVQCITTVPGFSESVVLVERNVDLEALGNMSTSAHLSVMVLVGTASCPQEHKYGMRMGYGLPCPLTSLLHNSFCATRQCQYLYRVEQKYDLHKRNSMQNDLGVVQ